MAREKYNVSKGMLGVLFSGGPVSKADLFGIGLTLVIFGIILIPFATSESDPYGVRETILSMEQWLTGISDKMGDSAETSGKVIGHIKIHQDQFPRSDQLRFGSQAVPL